MANLRNIKDRINSIKNTQKITKAMKMVAAAKVKKAENAVKASRPFTLELAKMFRRTYKEALNNILEESKTAEDLENYCALLSEREIKKVGVVVISSNKGLAGAYSANIVRHSTSLIKKLKSEGKEICVYFVGQKAVAPLKALQKQLGFEIKKVYSTILDEIDSNSAYILANELAGDYINKEIDSIELVTTRYKNMMTCYCETWRLLPIIKDSEIKEFHNEELTKELGIQVQQQQAEPLCEYLPNISSILSKIVPLYVTNIIYQALLEAQASELSSRMTAMSAATNNAIDMISSLTIEYNKARQAKITQELTEVISGAGALN